MEEEDRGQGSKSEENSGSVDAELFLLAKKIETLTSCKISADSILDLRGSGIPNGTAEQQAGGEHAYTRPLNDRFSVGDKTNNAKWKQKKRRESSMGTGRASLDMRDFDLDEVKKHRMSLLTVQNQSRESILPIANSKSSIEGVKGNNNCTLLEFATIGVDRKLLSGRIMPSWETRRQASQILDVFPTSTPLISDIGEYVFPSGVKLEIFNHEELYAMPPCGDSPHVLHFSDANGKPTYGTVLITTEVIPVNYTKAALEIFDGGLDSENGDIVAFLLILRKRVRAATTIQRFFALRTKGMRFAKTESNRMGSVVVQAVKHEKERARDALLRAASAAAPAPAAISMTSLWDRWMASRSVSARAKEEEAAAAPTARAFGRSASVEGRAAAAQYDFFDCDDDSTVMTTGSSNDGLRYRTRTDSSIPEDATATTVSEGAGAGVSAHADRNRYFVVTERAYCVLHDKPHHAAMLKVLRAVAEKEASRPVGTGGGVAVALPGETSPGNGAADRDSEELRMRARITTTANMVAASHGYGTSTTTGDGERTRTVSTCSLMSTGTAGSVPESAAQPPAIDLANTLSCDLLYAARTARRHAFLHYIQALPLRRIRPTKVSFPAYAQHTFHAAAARNSRAGEDWMIATLFSLLPAEVVVQMLSVLLCERSVVLHSSDAGLVTTIATALLALMAPFTWAGAFVPLLPLNCKEIMQAPVPFVVGATWAPHLERDVSPEAAVLFIDDYLQSSADSLEGLARSHKGLRRKKKYLYIPRNAQRSSPGDFGAAVDVAVVSDPNLISGGQRLCARIRTLAAVLRVGDKDTHLSVEAAKLQMSVFSDALTPVETDAVQALRLVTRAFTSEILGDLVDPEHSAEMHLQQQQQQQRQDTRHDSLQEGFLWARFGVLSTANKEDFTFYPEWFLDQHRNKLQFLAAAVKSQYFLTFVDELHLRDIRREGCRLLLRDWISYQMTKRNKTKKS